MLRKKCFLPRISRFNKLEDQTGQEMCKISIAFYSTVSKITTYHSDGCNTSLKNPTSTDCFTKHPRTPTPPAKRQNQGTYCTCQRCAKFKASKMVWGSASRSTDKLPAESFVGVIWSLLGGLMRYGSGGSSLRLLYVCHLRSRGHHTSTKYLYSKSTYICKTCTQTLFDWNSHVHRQRLVTSI